jgi:tetraprenyl-beta-curcumene synthase
MATAPRVTGRVGEVDYPELECALPDRQLTARAGFALALANARYWTTVAPITRAQLRHWEQRAQAIPDPVLKALALEKLREEHFNAEVASTLATLAPRAHRAGVVEAVVALEVMYDYLDGLTEQPVPDPLCSGHQLFQAFTSAVSTDPKLGQDYYRYHPGTEDGGYLQELSSTVKSALKNLPATAAIADAARASAARCAEAQIRVHAVPLLGSTQLEHWATRKAAGTGLQWREFLAGAVASVLAVHALIAAAADPHTTPEQAAAIDAAYLSISALSTMLDSLVDYAEDASTGRPWYLQHYANRVHLAQPLAYVTRYATAQARTLPNAAHHIMTLVGVAAYYTSAPTATDEPARPLVAHIHRELQPLITPTLAVMQTWRLAKRLRSRWHARSSTRDDQPT